MNSLRKVIVVGGGASGMMAAITARRMGTDVTILERNPRIGKKILVTGNGRCNFTNIKADIGCYHGQNPKFAHDALNAFSVSQTIGFFEKLGIAHKVEDLGKVFPMSDQASSVLDVLLYELRNIGVRIICDAYVKEIKKVKGKFMLRLENGNSYEADSVILACGGKAMPSTGSDGNGFELARKMGHKIINIFPALVQLKLEGNFFKQIDGVKLVGTAEVISNNVSLVKDKGDILFANYGISGPPILQVSRKAAELLESKKDAMLKLALIDTMTKDGVFAFLKNRFKNMPGKPLDFAMVGFINKRLIPVVLKQAGIRNLKVPVARISSDDIQKIATILTDWRFKITGTKSWPSAQVTAGGVDTAQIDEHTMESKLVKGLFFVGEIIDIDGSCGGFNLQWAWSSGYVAGCEAYKS